MILALDIGLRCGVCYGEPGGVPAVTCIELHGATQPGLRYGIFLEELLALLSKCRPQTVAVEHVCRHLGIHAAHTYGALRGLAELAAYRCEVRQVLPIGVQAAKKFVAGRGNAEKQEVLQLVRQRFPGVDIPGFDEADAVAVWLAACGTEKGG